jgi:DNA-binding PadR family transcriptional regulator
MKNQSGLTTLSLAIVGLISQRAMTGYDLKKVFEETPMGHFSSSPGAIYPALERLSKAGLIDGEVESAHALRPRLAYRLTDIGREALGKHLAQSVTRRDVVWNLEEMILRFAFMTPALRRGESVRFLKEFYNEVNGYAKELKAHLDRVQDSFTEEQSLALEHGIAKYEMNANWSQRALKRLSRGK